MKNKFEIIFEKNVALSIFIFGILGNTVGLIMSVLQNNPTKYITIFCWFFNVITFVYFFKTKKYSWYYEFSLLMTGLLLQPGILLTSTNPNLSILFDFMIPILYALKIKNIKSFIMPIVNLALIDTIIYYKLDLLHMIIYSAIYVFQLYTISFYSIQMQKNFFELEQNNDIFRNMARMDNLTQIFNLYGLKSKIQFDKLYYAIMIDIDNFKKINDTFGHDEGDRVLIKLSEMLKIHTSRNFLVSRKGGEEFLLLSSLNYEDTINACKNIIDNVRENLKSKNNNITISMGISNQNFYSDSLVKEADENLYLAKNNDKNCIYYNSKKIY